MGHNSKKKIEIEKNKDQLLRKNVLEYIKKKNLKKIFSYQCSKKNREKTTFF